MSSVALRTSRHPVVFLVVLAVLGNAFASGVVAGPLGQADAETLVVDADGDADYESIQAAIDDAAAGDTVEVRPGTYEGELVVDDSIALVAPRGATLRGPDVAERTPGIEIESGSGAAPVIEGFTVTNFYTGVSADETAGDWRLRGVTVAGNDDDGVAAGGTSGDWRIEDSVVRDNGDEGINAEQTTGAWTIANTTVADNEDDGLDVDAEGEPSAATGDWTIRDSVIRRNGGEGVDAIGTAGAWTIHNTTISGNLGGVAALSTTGDWTIRDAVVRNNSVFGVDAKRADGDWAVERSHLRYNRIVGVDANGTTGAWTIEDTTVRDSSVGVFARDTSGPWLITNSTVRDTFTLDLEGVLGDGVGVFASGSTGAWEIRHSNLVAHPVHAVEATDASPPGDATGNWWGDENGPAADDCVGNVDCGGALAASADVADPPTVPAGFDAEPWPTDAEREFGLASAAILFSLFGIVFVLAALSWRIR